jgi:thiopeptide-type bacteriocin biosynthesis protein
VLALTIDDLLGAIGLSVSERLAWYQKQTNARAADIGAEYRKRKDVLRRALSDPNTFVVEARCGGEIIELLNERRSVLMRAGSRITELREKQLLSRPVDELCSSFVHLHLNRLATSNALAEYQILGLLQRTRESLRNAPSEKVKRVSRV